MDKLKLEVGGTGEAMGRRFIEAWHRVEAGDRTPAEPVMILEDWQTFLTTFSEARLALMHDLAERGSAPSIRALADRLGRDYRRVHDDVSGLLAAGVLKREGTRVELTARRFEAALDLAPA